MQTGMDASDVGGLVAPTDLRMEYLEDPVGIDTRAPRLSWKLARGAAAGSSRSVRQTAYQVCVASDRDGLTTTGADLWDSGIVESGETTHIAYRGQPLVSRLRCFWCVRVRDSHGNWSPWSRIARWTMGLLDASDWHGEWIGTGESFSPAPGTLPIDSKPPPGNTLPDPWFRRSFILCEKPLRATAFVASVGYHELFVNGRKVGDAVLSPSVTDNSKRARYLSYEIGDFLSPGENVIGLWLGTGWSIFPEFETDDKPRAPIVRAQFDVELPDGSHREIVTDALWKTHASPNTLTGIWCFMNFGGEHYDANREVEGWAKPGHDDTAWKAVSVFKPALVLSSDVIEPNRLRTALPAVAVEETTSGEYRVDLGRNFAGWMEIDVRGLPGDRIEFLFSERREEAVTYRLRSAYVIGQSGCGTFRNRFNYSSCRWVTVRGLREKPVTADFRGWAVRNDCAEVSAFECSQPLLNQIHDVTRWTLENLLLGGYIVDCPQRERMGYGGDGHASLTTALSHFATGALCTKWSEDWRDVQGTAPSWGFGIPSTEPGGGGPEEGNMPYTAPTYWGGGGPSWCGFCVHLPWESYRHYGDVRILQVNFPTIVRWLGFLETKAHDNLLRQWGGDWDFLGDWMAPKETAPENGSSPSALFFNNCYWIYNLETAADIAGVLGLSEHAESWRTRAAQVREAVHDRFYDPADCSYVNGSQACQAIALVANVPPAPLRAAVEARLEREIHAKGGHIHAGITGGAFLFKALMEARRDDLIYSMVSKTTYPSWGYMLANGATTLWEGWRETHSLLHSSFLYVGAWFIQGVLGIQPDPKRDGFKKFVVHPAGCDRPELTWARGHYDSIHGRIAVSWKRSEGVFSLTLCVPPNTEARVCLPCAESGIVLEGGRCLAEMADVRVAGREGGRLILEVGSGDYCFTAPIANAPLTLSGPAAPVPAR